MNIESRVAQATVEELREWVAAGPPFSPKLLSCLRADTRTGVQAIYTACLRARREINCEKRRMDKLLTFEREAAENGFVRVAGVDEAGRGPAAGPLVAAAVILRGPAPEGVNDSKQLTGAQREALYDAILGGGHIVGVGMVDAETLDRHGLQSANYGAMMQAVAQLSPAPDFLLVDGFCIQGCALPQRRIIKGDRLSASIAAASIVAKVTRDRLMTEMDALYPGYGFSSHKGYCTQEHQRALAALGPCPIHRRSFATVCPPVTESLLFEL